MWACSYKIDRMCTCSNRIDRMCACSYKIDKTWAWSYGKDQSCVHTSKMYRVGVMVSHMCEVADSR